LDVPTGCRPGVVARAMTETKGSSTSSPGQSKPTSSPGQSRPKTKTQSHELPSTHLTNYSPKRFVRRPSLCGSTTNQNSAHNVTGSHGAGNSSPQSVIPIRPESHTAESKRRLLSRVPSTVHLNRDLISDHDRTAMRSEGLCRLCGDTLALRSVFMALDASFCSQNCRMSFVSSHELTRAVVPLLTAEPAVRKVCMRKSASMKSVRTPGQPKRDRERSSWHGDPAWAAEEVDAMFDVVASTRPTSLALSRAEAETEAWAAAESAGILREVARATAEAAARTPKLSVQTSAVTSMAKPPEPTHRRSLSHPLPAACPDHAHLGRNDACAHVWPHAVEKHVVREGGFSVLRGLLQLRVADETSRPPPRPP